MWSAVSALGAALGGSSAKAATEAGTGNKLKVVYHLSDAEKVNFVLGNIQNHIDRVGGPQHVTIALVIHGPALKRFTGHRPTPTSASASAISPGAVSSSRRAPTP